MLLSRLRQILTRFLRWLSPLVPAEKTSDEQIPWFSRAPATVVGCPNSSAVQVLVWAGSTVRPCEPREVPSELVPADLRIPDAQFDLLIDLYENLPVKVLRKEEPCPEMEANAQVPAHIAAHEGSIYHRHILLESESCGCFFCLAIFSPGEIVKWVDEVDQVGTTAICPKCGIDAVIGSASGCPVTQDFLRQMQRYWF
jgi:hypothetical protein